MAARGSDERHDEVPGSGADPDLYGVLGLKKECSDADLRIAYRRLAMTWHPDRCSASGSSARVEEAKERFQQIQGAYSVLSDSGKRLLYDVGVYESDDDNSPEALDEQDDSGMDGFLGEMAEMMRQATPTESFEELQQLFVDMFHGDLFGGFGFDGPPPMVHRAQAQAQSEPCISRSTFAQTPPSCKGGVNNKRCSSAMYPWMPTRTYCSGSLPDLSSSSSKTHGNDWKRREGMPWKGDDLNIDGTKKKQRLSRNHGHGGSSSEYGDISARL